MTPAVIQAVVFYFLAAMVVASCAVVVFAKNIVNSVFALFFTLFGIAGFYALLGADFLAVTQVIIYVGGILVLLLFGILLTNRAPIVLGLTTRRTYLLGVVAGAVVFAILIAAIHGMGGALESRLPEPKPTTESLGRLILGRYLFPFEFASLTLLAALVGAAYLVRRDDK